MLVLGVFVTLVLFWSASGNGDIVFKAIWLIELIIPCFAWVNCSGVVALAKLSNKLCSRFRFAK
ncbi:hypothetical protein NW066_01490 [Mycoplasmopsis felis]|nr:hypothetical protein [Mycoplasmopsis felis]MCU9932020.1 hypothetical protein [Mycoplasmopsis felis]UWV85380.1 hypothetical protein NW066_01490 [Mycoplasmopsis felis]